jgi:hypothetical protein
MRRRCLQYALLKPSGEKATAMIFLPLPLSLGIISRKRSQPASQPSTYSRQSKKRERGKTLLLAATSPSSPWDDGSERRRMRRRLSLQYALLTERGKSDDDDLSSSISLPTEFKQEAKKSRVPIPVNRRNGNVGKRFIFVALSSRFNP